MKYHPNITTQLPKFIKMVTFGVTFPLNSTFWDNLFRCFPRLWRVIFIASRSLFHHGTRSCALPKVLKALREPWAFGLWGSRRVPGEVPGSARRVPAEFPQSSQRVPGDFAEHEKVTSDSWKSYSEFINSHPKVTPTACNVTSKSRKHQPMYQKIVTCGATFPLNLIFWGDPFDFLPDFGAAVSLLCGHFSITKS